MTNPHTTLLELADRCEQATVADRELDGAICVALQFGGENSEGAANVRLEVGDAEWLEFEIGEEACCNKVPELTASLDSAMSLIPEGWTWDVDATVPEMGIDWTLHEPIPDGLRIKGSNEQPALALCAASLRARASMQEPS
jgi:hypothetical protein